MDTRDMLYAFACVHACRHNIASWYDNVETNLYKNVFNLYEQTLLRHVLVTDTIHVVSQECDFDY